jgi:uncharacterized phage-like protein YoqJ
VKKQERLTEKIKNIPKTICQIIEMEMNYRIIIGQVGQCSISAIHSPGIPVYHPADS